MVSQTVDASKRVAIITGCSEPNSLGAAFSRDLLARGWTVFATARKESTLSQLKEAGCHTLELDVCSDVSVTQATQKLVTLTGGRVDLVINNVSHKRPLRIGLSIDCLGRCHRIRTLGSDRSRQARLDA
jgi:NADP-dependent 3-hydroxy acid dehydrogenase YdfG